MSLGDATADVREALGAARLAVAEDLLAEQILGCSDAPLSALVGLVLVVLPNPSLSTLFVDCLLDSTPQRSRAPVSVAASVCLAAECRLLMFKHYKV